MVTEKGQSVDIQREAKNGELYTYAVKVRPEVETSQRERQLMRSFMTEFGLSPASRTRISVPEPAREPDGIAALLD